MNPIFILLIFYFVISVLVMMGVWGNSDNQENSTGKHYKQYLVFSTVIQIIITCVILGIVIGKGGF